jgi:hypothetical protein
MANVSCQPASTKYRKDRTLVQLRVHRQSHGCHTVSISGRLRHVGERTSRALVA